MLRFLRVTILLVLVGGCATALPSPPEARVPSPGSVTKDNPAGDAESPVDAALMRLLTEPIGAKDDRYRTLRPRLPDADNWKRVRFFGYPTRAGFRYGSDHYALALIDYSEAEDATPRACLEHFVARAQQAADLFDLEVGPIQREVRTHRRGVEAVDWAKWQVEEDARRKEASERRKKLREERKKRAEEKRRRRAELQRQQAEATKDAPADNVGAKTEPAKAEPASIEPVKSEPAKDVAIAKTQKVKPADPAVPATDPDLGRRLRTLGTRLFQTMRPASTPDDADEPEAKSQRIDVSTTSDTVSPSAGTPKAGVRRLFGARAKSSPFTNLGEADMPVIRTTGAFNTLFNDDRYLAAIVAYESWPGTCLVHGFAVQVGSDEDLARQVLERWIEEAAPQLRWRGALRSRPEIENR
jgi:hypothetical protein